MTGSHQPNRKTFKSPMNQFNDNFTLVLIELKPMTLKSSKSKGFLSIGIMTKNLSIGMQ